MEEQINDVVELLKQQDINGCITGSYMLGYHPDWNQDIDLFVYDKSSFNKLLFFCHYNSMFNILDPLELNKFQEYIDNEKSSLESLGLITIKFKYNLCIDVNIIYKKFYKNIFDVISNFDLDLIAQGYDIKTKQYLSLRQSTGMEGTWNKYNPVFYEKANKFWSWKRLVRQFERVVKYTKRGYNLESVTDKYIEIIENAIKTENYYKSEKGTAYFEETIEQFEIVLKILKIWKEKQEISEINLLLLKQLI